ncbi:MAG: D-alanyl-D-alanine carboxypeptidase [Sinobacteraceae bacterium]|nr:D-alanyl-D-alanine carboxypeptidase [Nevskiaceae bacterium]
MAAEIPTLVSAARLILGSDQGVYVEAADGSQLLAQAASRPVHPASVSKVPTTLALLRKFGPDHRFATTFSTSGAIVDGTLYGDLIVQSEGDPSLVDENALVIATRLRVAGIQRVVGGLRPVGTLTFDWQPDPDGTRMRAALSGHVSEAALAAVRALQTVGSEATILPAATHTATESTPLTTAPLASIVFAEPGTWSDTDRARSALAPSAQPHPLLVHRSQPLLALAKSLNDYSNNIFKPLADQAGGALAVQQLARAVLPESMRPEVTLGDGAGTDPRNRLSPRAAVRLLEVLDHELTAQGRNLTDILPVAGIDPGTLQKRINGPHEVGRVVGKTGTFGDYGASALVGAVPTSDHGTVYFAILNHNVPVPEARRRQDRFVAVLLGQLHSSPWKYERDSRPAVQRAELVSLSP